MTLAERASDGERHIIVFADGWRGEMRMSERGGLLIKGNDDEAPTRYDPRKADKILTKKHGALMEDHQAVVRKKRYEPEEPDEPEEPKEVDEAKEENAIPYVMDIISEDGELEEIDEEDEEEEEPEEDTAGQEETVNEEPERVMISEEENTMLQTGAMATTNNNAQSPFTLRDSASQSPIMGAGPITLPRPQAPAETKPIVPKPYSQGDNLTVIQETITIEGNINAKSDVRINGKVKGNVNSTEDVTITGAVVGTVKGGSVTIAPNQNRNAVVEGNVSSESSLSIGNGAIVSGDVTAKEALIQGAVKGSVIVEGRVILDSTAIVLGDIKAGIIVMYEGMRYSGNVTQTGGGDTPETFFKSLEKPDNQNKKENGKNTKEDDIERGF